MYIKNTITFFWVGLLSANILFAQDMMKENSNPGTGEISSLKAAAQIDSAAVTPEELINLPFSSVPDKFTAGDITTINSDEILMYDNINSVTEAIGGRVPGLYGGTNLRGLGNALIVIDGIPRSITEVNLNEIEQITVLKDVNSGILYGVQANNGVILIKTKRGYANQKKITARVETGFSKPISFPNYLRSAEYMQLYNEALTNDGLATLYTQEQIDATREGTNIYKYPDVNYFNSTFLKDYKPSTRAEIDFSGGNSGAQYYANVGYQRSGTLYNMGESTHSDRINLRSNLNFRINDFINSHVDIATIFTVDKSPIGNFFNDATTLKPNYYPPLIDPSLIQNPRLLKTALYVNGGYLLGGTSLYKNNVYGNLLVGGYNRTINTTGMFNAGLDFDLGFITKGLVFKTYSSFTFYSSFNENQTNTYAVYEPKWLTDLAGQDSLAVTKIGADKFSGTQGISGTSLSRDYAIYGMLDYSNKFGNSELNATMLGYFDQFNITGTFQTDKHSHLGARINYIYNNRYIVNFNSALVSSPKLAPDHRLGFSPSVSLGWVMSEESFLKGNSFINYLKLRFSAGIINTDMSLSRYYTYDNILAGSSTYSWGDAYRSNGSTIFTNIATDKLFYEKRKEMTIGAEATMLNNLLWLDVNYFRDNKSDLIILGGLSNTYPAFIGGLYPAENYNADSYSGVEVGLSVRKSINDFSFDIGPSLLFLNTEIVKRDEFFGEDYLYTKGKSTGVIFGLESEGFFTNQADIDSHATQLFGPVVPGDLKYKDQNGDGFIDSNDQIAIGTGTSKFVGGLSLRMNYKNFSLFALASARNGADRIFSGNYYWISGDLKYSDVVLNRWTPETAATATYPRLSSKSNSNNFRNSTFWLEKNNLVSIDRVQLTYNFSENISSKVFTKNLSLYVRGSNLLNIAENKDKMELNVGSEPQYRYYAIGLKALF